MLPVQAALEPNPVALPDFLGAGIATWTYDTLAAELEREGG